LKAKANKKTNTATTSATIATVCIGNWLFSGGDVEVGVGEFVCQVISMGSIALFGGVKKLLLRIYLWAKIIICLDEI
jgi:hypothetical protein